MSSEPTAHYHAQLDAPLIVSSVNSEEYELTTSPSSPSPVASHLKLHSRRYAVVLLTVASLVIGLLIGWALFGDHHAGMAAPGGNGSSSIALASSGLTAPSPPGTGGDDFPSGQRTGGFPPGRPTGEPPVGPTGSDPFTGLTAVLTGVPAVPTCNATSIIEEGPFFVDEKLDRSDLYPTAPGVFVTVTFALYNSTKSQCVALPNAKLDVWSANYLGKYSDEQSEGTKGQTYLRGYQLTNTLGRTSFNISYPGFYEGRTTHWHMMVRTYDASGNQLYRSTTQMYFDDALTDYVYTLAPYTSHTGRRTRNEQDRIFKQSHVMPLVGDVKSGYKAEVSLVVPFVR